MREVLQGRHARLAGLCLLASLLLTLTGCQSDGNAGNGSSGAGGGPPEATRLDGPPRAVLEQGREAAIREIIVAMGDENPFVRANAVEAAHAVPDRLAPLLGRALEDKHRAVRFAALVTVGKFRLVDFVSAAERVLVEERLAEAQMLDQIRTLGPMVEPEQRRLLEAQLSEIRAVQAAALFAMQMCGREINITPMANMLAGSDPRLQANVAMLLGRMGDKSAIPMLRELARGPMDKAEGEAAVLAKVQLTEALIRLGDDTSLTAMRSYIYSQSHEVRVLAIEAIGEVGDQRWVPGLMQILNEERNNLELRLAAARALAKLGNPHGLQVALEASRAQPAVFRAMAGRTLGYFSDPTAAQSLLQLLADADQRVRLAAATGILETLARPQ